jgi:hypothetical protein
MPLRRIGLIDDSGPKMSEVQTEADRMTSHVRSYAPAADGQAKGVQHFIP